MQNGNSITKRKPDQESESIYYSDSDDGYSNGYYGASPEPSEKQQLAAFFAVLRKRLLLIVAFALLVTALVIVYEAQKPDYYTADVRIQVNNEMNPATGGSSSGSIVLNPGNDPAYFTTQLQILEGSGRLRRVVKPMDL